MIEAKLLGQERLNATPMMITSGISYGTRQITSMWVCNVGTVQRKFTMYAHGSEESNMIINQEPILPGDTKFIGKTEMLVILNGTSDMVFMKQDEGNDLIATIYGIDDTILGDTPV